MKSSTTMRHAPPPFMKTFPEPRKQKKRIRTLDDISSSADWERIFTSRKRTFIQKAYELEISTGCWVTATVFSPSGEVWFYATTDNLRLSLLESGLINNDSVHVTGETMKNNVLLSDKGSASPPVAYASNRRKKFAEQTSADKLDDSVEDGNDDEASISADVSNTSTQTAGSTATRKKLNVSFAKDASMNLHKEKNKIVTGKNPKTASKQKVEKKKLPASPKKVVQSDTKEKSTHSKANKINSNVSKNVNSKNEKSTPRVKKIPVKSVKSFKKTEEFTKPKKQNTAKKKVAQKESAGKDKANASPNTFKRKRAHSESTAETIAKAADKAVGNNNIPKSTSTPLRHSKAFPNPSGARNFPRVPFKIPKASIATDDDLKREALKKKYSPVKSASKKTLTLKKATHTFFNDSDSSSTTVDSSDSDSVPESSNAFKENSQNATIPSRLQTHTTVTTVEVSERPPSTTSEPLYNEHSSPKNVADQDIHANLNQSPVKVCTTPLEVGHIPRIKVEKNEYDFFLDSFHTRKRADLSCDSDIPLKTPKTGCRQEDIPPLMQDPKKTPPGCENVASNHCFPGKKNLPQHNWGGHRPGNQPRFSTRDNARYRSQVTDTQTRSYSSRPSQYGKPLTNKFVRPNNGERVETFSYSRTRNEMKFGDENINRASDHTMTRRPRTTSEPGTLPQKLFGKDIGLNSNYWHNPTALKSTSPRERLANNDGWHCPRPTYNTRGGRRHSLHFHHPSRQNAHLRYIPRNSSGENYFSTRNTGNRYNYQRDTSRSFQSRVSKIFSNPRHDRNGISRAGKNVVRVKPFSR